MKLPIIFVAGALALAGCDTDGDYASAEVRESWGTVPPPERVAASTARGAERVAESTGRGIARTGETIEVVGERTAQGAQRGAEWVGERFEPGSARARGGYAK